jgi:hypothetical protein
MSTGNPQPGDFVRYGDETDALKGRLLRIDQYGQAVVYCTDNKERVMSYGRLTKLAKRS